jgi:hypothetical protein
VRKRGDLPAEPLGNQRRGNAIGTKRVSLAVVVDLGWFARLCASSRNMKISASIVVLLRFSVSH